MKKQISIVLVISILFTFFVLLSRDQSSIANTKPIEIGLGAEKKVPIKPKPVLKKPAIVKPKAIVKKPVPVVKKPVEVDKKPKKVNILVTYYSNNINDCGKTDAISASGKDLNKSSYRTYVAAPENISFGTKIDVDKIGSCQVEDRGGKIKYVEIRGIEYLKLDVFVKGATRQQLLNKGIVKTKGVILED